MVFYISHRGNLTGRNPERENTHAYIQEAINSGFYVEIDLWGKDGDLWLGHDSPQYKTSCFFLGDHYDRLFCHCKNVEAIDIIMKELPHIEFFYHNTDDYTLTNHGLVWCYPGKTPPKKEAIIVLPEGVVGDVKLYLAQHNPVGVCSDHIKQLKS